MRKGTLAITALALCLLTASASAQVKFDWEMALTLNDPDFSHLSRTISETDLISGFDVGGFGGFFEGGWIDNANGVNAFNFDSRAYPYCLRQWDGIETTTKISQLYGFWHGYGDTTTDPNFPSGGCAPINHFLEMTDGVGEFAVVLRDFARSAGVFRFHFDAPTDIGEIVFYSKNAGGDVRAFHHYDVYVSYNNGASYVALKKGVISGWVGAANSSWSFPELGEGGHYGAAYTHVYDCSNPVLAAGITDIRFVVHPSGIGDLIMDPWRGYWNESDKRCEPNFPAEAGDLDGRYKPFVAPMVAEIDVLAPQTALLGDGNGDGIRNFTDAAKLMLAMKGPDDTTPNLFIRAFDALPKDCDVDLADVAAVQRVY